MPTAARRRSGKATRDLGGVSVESALLDNGMRIVTSSQPALHRVSIALFVGVGSRFEDRDNNGVSHFLEHMLYRGTPKNPSAHAQNLAFERLGGTLSAATASDHTTLSIDVPPSQVGPALSLLGELLESPRLGEMDVEKRIVREEILEDLDEDGRDVDPDNICRATMFRDHPLGFPITGPLKALDRFDAPMLRAHMRRFYVGKNVVLSVGGACEAKEVERFAQSAFGSMRVGKTARALPFESTQRTVRRKHVDSPGSQTDLRISFRTPGERDARAAAIDLLLRVLDDGMSTRLYHRLCDAGGLVYDCSAGWEPFIETGSLDVAAEVQHARLVEVVEVILSLLTELADHGPTQDEIDKARDRHRWGIDSAIDDAGEIAAIIGSAWMFDRPRSLRETARRLDAVTIDDVRAAAELIFRKDALTLVTVGTTGVRERAAIEKATRAFRKGSPS